MMPMETPSPMIEALKDIARGRDVNGRPLPAEEARQKARDVLIRAGVSWGKVKKPSKPPNPPSTAAV